MKKELFCALALSAAASSAAASCGAAFCSVNTSWDVQGAWQEPGLRLDLRFEHINQDQPRSGRSRVPFGQLRRHHDEIETRNRNLVAGLDYTLDPDWSFNAQLPLVHRGHAHIHNHMGARLHESWNFTEPGDARFVARRRLGGGEGAGPSVSSWGGLFGVKLPTGKTDVRNDSGLVAERSLQPGTGTADAILGAYYTRALPASGWSWFVQSMLELPLHYYRDYRPGRKVTLDVGTRYAASDRLSLLLQANAQHRKRDAGREAEPDDSGGSALFLSPGAGYAFTREWQVYGFLQLPLYQYVNGVQITPKRALALGVAARF